MIDGHEGRAVAFRTRKAGNIATILKVDSASFGLSKATCLSMNRLRPLPTWDLVLRKDGFAAHESLFFQS